MNIVIIPQEQRISVDGVSHTFDFTIDSDVHVVHWDGTVGEVEYKSKQNEKITNFTEYQHLLTERLASMDKAESSKVSDEKTRKNAQTALENRMEEVPSYKEQLEALYEARQGNNSKLIGLDAKISALYLKYPL